MERAHGHVERCRDLARAEIGIREQPVFDALHRGSGQRRRELFIVDDLIV
jgi:hypothetical protein